MGWIGWGMWLLAASLGAVAWLLATAPDGFEDERGFHYGPDPRRARELEELELRQLDRAARAAGMQ